MSNTKTVNFTNEQAIEMKTAFLALKDATTQKALVELFATKFGKNTRSIVAKASNLGVYLKAEKVSKTGAKIETKSDMVKRIAKKFDLSETVIGSLEFATKQALISILSIKAIEAETENNEAETQE